MGIYKYGGVELPKLPEWDKVSYPYAELFYTESENRYTLMASTIKKKYGTFTLSGKNYTGVYMFTANNEVAIKLNYYPGTSETWEELKTTILSSSAVYIAVNEGQKLIWTNYDVLYKSDGQVYFSASIPEITKTSGDGFSLYNGKKIPNIDIIWTEELKTKYPYTFLAFDTSINKYVIYGTVEPCNVYESGNVNLKNYFLATLADKNWVDFSEGEESSNSYLQIIWTSYDIYVYSEEMEQITEVIYLASSKPISLDNMKVVEWNGKIDGLEGLDNNFYCILDYFIPKSAISVYKEDSNTFVSSEFILDNNGWYIAPIGDTEGIKPNLAFSKESALESGLSRASILFSSNCNIFAYIPSEREAETPASLLLSKLIGYLVGQKIQGVRASRLQPGLYKSKNSRELVYSLSQLTGNNLISGGVVHINTPYIKTNYAGSGINATNTSNTYLDGHLILPFDGSVTVIDEYAFSKCKSLKTIIIPDGVTTIRDCAFDEAETLVSVTIPDSVKTMGRWVFQDCKKLINIRLPKGITEIPDSTFSGCKSLVNINIPESVINFDEYAFRSCASLTSINIPEEMTSIPLSLFSGCTNLTTVNSLSNITSIDNYGFNNCKNLMDVDLSKVTTIGYSAFTNCKKLERLDLSSIKSIDKYAFQGCNSLKTIYFPDSMPSIALYAFYYVSNVKVYITNLSGWCSYASFGTSNNPAGYLYLNDELIEHLVVPSDVSKIGAYTFMDNLGLISVDLGNVTSIANGAFQGCKNLTTVIIPNSVKTLGNNIFNDCINLTSLTIPSSVTSIGWFIIRDCEKLLDITYTGTMAQWNKITLDDDWDYGSANYTIHCTDGDIAKTTT